ncbi:MAG: MFS transporter [Intestinimonas sp.]|jgi:EmrB/QacA subfamily drug resistance transporter|nr:MFS transporter [Intestinimonas sp.]
MPERQISRSKIALLLIGLMASLLLSALDSTVVSTAMKSIVGSLGGMSYYSWPFTIYMLCSMLAIPISGGLTDIYGHKPIFLTGIAAFLGGSSLCGLSQSMIQLIVFRGFQGIGGGMLVSGVFTAVADLFEPADRGKYTGIVTSMFGLASIVGPLAGGFITDFLGWRWIFFLNLPLGGIAMLIIATAMPSFKSGELKKPVDSAGIAALVFTLVPLLLVLSMAGKTFPWLSIPCISLFLLSGVMAAVFLFAEKTSGNPMFPPAFFRNRAISISFFIAFFSQALMFSAIMYLPYFIQGVIGSTATTSGAVITPMMLGLLLASNITGQLISRVGKARLLSILAFLIMGVGEYLLSTMDTGSAYSEAILFMVILGFGVGISMPITNVNAQNAAPRQQIGTATSGVMFFRRLGSTIGSAVYGVIVTNTLTAGLSGLPMHRLPEHIQELLKNTQVITNAQAVAGIRAEIPDRDLSRFDDVYLHAKEILAHSVHTVFLFCICLAVVGLVGAFFLREAPVTIKKPPQAKLSHSHCGQPPKI